MNILLILLIILLLCGGGYGYSNNMAYVGHGSIGLIVVIVLIFLLSGRG